MKMFPSKNLISLLILIFSLFNQVLNTGCLYEKKPGETPVNTDDDNYLTGISDDEEAKEKCFSLSYTPSYNKKCCYKDKKCIDETEATADECPKDTTIPNNCGMAGTSQPVIKGTCIDISLVQSYCCFVKGKDKSNVCIRTKKLNKDVNTATDQINDYVKEMNTKFSKNFEIESVECHGIYINYFWTLVVFIFALLF